MAKLLLNADGKVLTSNDKVLKAPEVEDRLKTFIENRGAASLFYNYSGISVDDLISYSDTENFTNMSSMFNGCLNLQTIPQLDTGNATNMTYMFNGCTNLQTIPQLDTSKVTSMGYMFSGCTNLQTIPQLNTSKATSMNYMFQNCQKLTEIPQLDTNNANGMNNMFGGCSSLQTIDLTSMDKITSTSSSSSMCKNCYSLTKFIIRNMTKIPSLNSNAFINCHHFKGTVDSTYNPEGLKDGCIYVPDNKVNTLKTATNWSAYADIIVPLSTLQEE